jgi:hypothetical protein
MEVLKMATENLEQKIKNLEEAIKSFQHEMERLRAVNEIQNLMSIYEYLHMTNRHRDVMEMYAKNAPDVRIAMKEMGYWEGPDAPQRGWGDLERKTQNPVGVLAIHPTTTPVIEVAGDGKTAKGVWIGTGFVASVDEKTGKPRCMWEWDRYGVDFVKEDGKWKFWHFHVYTLFDSGWDDSWAEQFTKKSVEHIFPDEFKPDGPPIDSYPYRPDTVVQLVPVPPEPYKTFDENTAY